MYPAAVHYFGPGATPQQQADAAYAQQPSFYAGFGTSKPKVFNWVGEPQPQMTMQDGQAMLDAWYAKKHGGSMKQPHINPAQQRLSSLQQQLQEASLRKQISDLRPQPAMKPTPQPTAQPTPEPAPTPSPVPQSPTLNLPSLKLPQTPQFGGIGTNYGGGIGPGMQVNTGIQSGMVPQSAIQSAVSAAKAPAAAPIMPNVSGAQASALGQLFQDGLAQQQSQNAVDLTRSGAYEQSQLQNAMQKARASAGLDWANLGTRFQETAQSAQQPYMSFLWNLLGSVA